MHFSVHDLPARGYSVMEEIRRQGKLCDVFPWLCEPSAPPQVSADTGISVPCSSPQLYTITPHSVPRTALHQPMCLRSAIPSFLHLYVNLSPCCLSLCRHFSISIPGCFSSPCFVYLPGLYSDSFLLICLVCLVLFLCYQSVRKSVV